MTYLPDNDKQRKALPLFKFLTTYFPKTFREMCKVSVVNNVRYNPGRDPADINWARDKSKDQLGSSLRHMLDSAIDGKVYEPVKQEIAELTGIDRIYVLAENAWRACAACELEIEKQEGFEQADPVFELAPGQWYFSDETWSDSFGPYPTEVEARAGLARYSRESLEGQPTPLPGWRSEEQPS